MSDPATITPNSLKRYANAMAALADFKRHFGRELNESTIAKIYVAEKLGRHFNDQVKQPGYDLLGPTGVRYQVKCRGAGTQSVDLNNFDYDYVVLVNGEPLLAAKVCASLTPSAIWHNVSVTNFLSSMASPNNRFFE